MVSVGAAVAGCDLAPPRNALSLTPPPLAMAKLQRLHAAAGRLAEDAPEIIANPEVARGLEQALIEALVGCLGVGEVREDKSALRQHALILRRFRSAVEENPDQPLYIPDLCKAIGVSDRTLRICCEEQLGMSPKRYLLLRRMHLARRALREAAPTATTVTEIADAIRLLGVRAVRRQLPVALRGIAVRHARSPARLAAGSAAVCFLDFCQNCIACFCDSAA